MTSTTVRLEDIARRAGVSRNTVSVALRNKPGVSDGTGLQPGDNPDGDPANNEWEFIFGTDPFDGADFPGTTLFRGGTPDSPTLVFSFTFNGEVENSEISIEASDDLVQWHPATGLTETSRTIQPDGQVELEFTASQPFDSGTPRFYRLKII